MITDAFNTFALAVATGNIGTNLLGDVINLEDIRDIGAGRQVFLNVVVDVAIAATAGGTYAVKLTTGTDAALSTPVDLIVSGTFDSAAGIAAGTVLLNIALPAEGAAYKQYIGVQEVVAVANTSAGAINAFLTIDQLAYQAYPDAVN